MPFKRLLYHLNFAEARQENGYVIGVRLNPGSNATGDIHSGNLQHSSQILMVDPIECLELMQIDQRGFIVIFYTHYDRAEQTQIALNCSSLQSTTLFMSQEEYGNWPKTLFCV